MSCGITVKIRKFMTDNENNNYSDYVRRVAEADDEADARRRTGPIARRATKCRPQTPRFATRRAAAAA